MIAYVIPTRNRPECLARTLAALGSLPAHDAEVVVVDNASVPPPHAPIVLANGLPVTLVMRARNEGAAARNAGARAVEPICEWIVMLDDDSHPLNLDFLAALREQPADVAAVCAEIVLPLGRESGGLPEVPIGCGVAFRREAFLGARIHDTGGYDPRFGFYAEEYDLAARFMREGRRIVMDRRFVVLHEKTPAGRSMDTILRRLVRNNAWVMGRYAPGGVRTREIGRTIARYGRIAMKEHAQIGFAAGLAELAWTLPRQPRLELNAAQWDGFIGASACRTSIHSAKARFNFRTTAIVAPGKNEHVIHECLLESGCRLTDDPANAEAIVIGTLSPGPMLDAFDTLGADPRVIAPWSELVEQPLAATAAVREAA